MQIKVLDSSSIIRDPLCLQRFNGAYICIPMTVIEELDRIKGKISEASTMARRFIKEFDTLSSGDIISFPGVRVGNNTVCVISNDNLTPSCLSLDLADND